MFQNYSAACKIASSGKHSGSVRTIKFLSSNHFGENHPKSLDRAWQKRLPGKKYTLKKRLSEIKFHDRETTFQQRNKYASVNYHSLLYKIKCRRTLSSLKEIIKGRCHFIQNKQHLKELFKTGILLFPNLAEFRDTAPLGSLPSYLITRKTFPQCFSENKRF